jgi:ATP-dependent protease Clp ATPase subunit
MTPELEELRKAIYCCIGCGKNFSEVKRMIQFHPIVCICNGCIQICVDMLEEEDKKDGPTK